MNYKQVLKGIWKKSKWSFVLSLFAVLSLAMGHFLKLGKLFSFIRKPLENKVRTPWNPTQTDINALDFYVNLVMNVFKFKDTDMLKEAYPLFHDHSVNEFNEVRFSVMKDDNGGAIVCFRGSETTQNWIDNFITSFTYDPELNATLHSGYLELAKGIANILEERLDKEKPVTLCGGSLGGAMSIGVGWLLDSRGYDVAKIYAFANPRITDDDYSHLNILTILNKQDPVVFLPVFTPLQKYRHQGKRLVIDADGWHEYKDCGTTDFLLSYLFLDRPLVPSEHGAYVKRLNEFKQTLND